MPTIRLSIPESARKNEVIEIKAMIQHPMETGYRRGMKGEVIERDLIKFFKCTYNDKLIFSSEFFPGIAANPFLTFYAKAEETGELNFSWTDQNGVRWNETRTLTVT
ncbi:MAG: thiosulfate oxidation carrier complex protein SoxZ [Ponticaulis sp.]|nr:thiosulfate oxidation carrier complex protein SoxZ [Ponticaulis sp.]|tara:strand:+ start:21927 stop:22247 length:321 start_codon:yes stop_codon:yes gene_type:complete